MEEKIILDVLTKDNVNIKKQNVTTINGVEYLIGEPWARCYFNNTQDRKDLQLGVKEPYLSVVMLMWGTTPTVADLPTS